MKGVRREKLGMEIQRVVSELLCFEVSDPRIRHVTVRGVRLTGDGGIARVYYESGLASPEKKSLRLALEHASGFLKKGIATRLELKSVPQLEFYEESL